MTNTTDTTDTTDTTRRPLWCTECGERAQRRGPTRWAHANGPRPSHSHLDGEPLCPVATDGYRPAAATARRPVS